MLVTVFWSHPRYGSGTYQVDALSAASAGEEAAESLPEDLIDDDPYGHGYELELSLIRDDLDVRVWVGRHAVRHAVRPGTIPDFTFT